MLLTVAQLALLVQVIIDLSLENIICNLLAYLALYMTTQVVFHPGSRNAGTAFTGTVLFITVTANSLAPMLGTLLEGHSLLHNLIEPVETFFHRLIYTFAMLLAHIAASRRAGYSITIRRKINQFGTSIGTNLLLPISALWMLGIIGLAAFLIKYLPLPTELKKVFDAFSFLLYAPYLLVLKPYSSRLKNKSQLWWLLPLYVIHLGITLANNSRAGMIGPVATVGAGWLITLLTGLTVVHGKFISRLAIIGVTGIFLVGQLSDLSSAILIERANRSTRSPGEQLAATLDRFWDKPSLASYRINQAMLNFGIKSDEVWQEDYIQNNFLARFIQIKFDDNCFNRIQSFNDLSIAELQKTTYEKLIVTLPEPLLNLMGIQIDKKEVAAFSIGDKIEMLSGKGSYGSFRTASVPAHSYGVLGWFYPLVLFAAYYIIFILLQSLVLNSSRQDSFYFGVSTLSLLLAYKMFGDISLDSLVNVISVPLRGLWQIVLFYCLSIWLIKKFGFKIIQPRSSYKLQNRYLSTFPNK